MPIYDFRCQSCGEVTTATLKLKDFTREKECTCGGRAQLVISTPAMVVGDYGDYISPATGKLISGRKQHLEDLKKSGCRLLESGETQEYRKSLQDSSRDFENFVNEAVATSAEKMGVM